MPDININGIVVNFPVKPYPVQEEYMSKVIECLQNSKHGVLESPTGTGKTLSLLCSSLSWLLAKKAQLQVQVAAGAIEKADFGGAFLKELNNGLEKAVGIPDQATQCAWAQPKIIYASRTHSQLSQAMQELKRTSYKHVTAAVLGSRDQLCIHPEVVKESNSSNKIHMCLAKVRARTCFYYNNIESRKDDPIFREQILDIEDLVQVGQKMKCCPYFLSREMKQKADITFMPYNYLLDPKARKAQAIELQNNVVLLDEAHNVERTCEEAASLQISSTDIAMCIDEITAVMQDMADEMNELSDFSSEANGPVQKDFTADDLVILKTMFLELEKAIDGIEIHKREEGDTKPGGYIFELLEKADLTYGKDQLVTDKLDKVILYLTTSSTSPFARKGNALQKFNDLLRIAFSPAHHRMDAIKRCYKVHIQVEESKKGQRNDNWEIKRTVKKSEGKLINYWCFSAGFGMQQLVEQGVRSVILTSGTLAPLKAFISEIGIPVDVQLENPHIVTGDQICVGVLSQGPDGFPLNSSYNTRNDPKYIGSLGRTIYNFSCLIPHGLLVFFPSYPIMKKCREEWQNTGLWTKIAERKPIYVEPQTKDGFANVMCEYYKKIQDPSCKGAIFMAVCRGKVSEGLDFANANGRAVLITGLPYPPLKDPRVILKQRYLEEIRSTDKEALTGQQWYQLEASRAVNQAIGRIIRHKNDYGAIILCDRRFENASFKKELSAWLRPHVKHYTNFGMVTKQLRDFFKYAEHTMPDLGSKTTKYKAGNPIHHPTSFVTSGRASQSQDIQLKKSTTSAPSKDEQSFDINMYMSDAALRETRKEVSTDFSQLLSVESKPVINFSSCKLSGNCSTSELTKDINEPKAKRRKLKIEFNTNIYDASTSSSSMGGITDITPKQDDTESAKADDKDRGRIYLQNVKRSLSARDYGTFGAMILNYAKSGNFADLLEKLKVLFPPTGELRSLFIGVKSFLKDRHVAEFERYIKQLEPPRNNNNLL